MATTTWNDGTNLGDINRMDAESLLQAAINNPQIGQGEQPTPEAPAAEPDPPENIQRALRDLVHQVELQSDLVRRFNVQRWREAEEFWRGNQNVFWNDNGWDWLSPVNSALSMWDADQEDADRPLYDYVVNIFTAIGLSIIAAISQKLPEPRFLPSSATSEQDIATAKAANRILQVFRSNNDAMMERLYEAYLLYTQGSVASYIRYVIDSSKFGETNSPVYEMRPTELMPERIDCANCPGFARMSHVSANPLARPTCPHCGAPLSLANHQPAEMGQVPVVVRYQKVPNGGEISTSYGPLNFKVAPFARNLHDSQYIGLVEEFDKGSLRAIYPGKAQQIRAGLTDNSTDNSFEAQARLSLMGSWGPSNTSPFTDLVTYRRFWLRPEAFWRLENEDERKELLQRYPDGAYVAFAGYDVFLEARPEKLDDHWVHCHAMPGQGMYRSSLGDCVIPLQKNVNDSVNQITEERDYAAAPPILYDARFISNKGLENRRCSPGNFMPVVIEGGTNKQLEEMMFQPKFGIDQNTYGMLPQFINLAQFVSGAQPSIIGTGEAHLDTAKAYQQAQATALGRLELTWKMLKDYDAQKAKLAVETFQRNRTEDYEMVIEGKSAAFRSEFIRLGEIRGSIVVKPNEDEELPTSFADIRQTLVQIIQSKDPMLMQLLSAPENLPALTRYLSLPDIINPDEQNRDKQAREIDWLLQGQPTFDGQQWIPTVEPDLYVDNHDVHIEFIREWAVSDEGITCKQTNPAGYDNVIAHLLAHVEAKVQLQQLMSAAQADAGGAQGPADTSQAQPPAAPVATPTGAQS